MCNDILCFEAWRDLNEDELDIRFAESGADREADFDYDLAVERAYGNYVRDALAARKDRKDGSR